MKTFTIINNNKLVGVIKLQPDIIKDIKVNEAIVLTQEVNAGDSKIITLKLSLIEVNMVK